MQLIGGTVLMNCEDALSYILEFRKMIAKLLFVERQSGPTLKKIDLLQIVLNWKWCHLTVIEYAAPYANDTILIIKKPHWLIIACVLIVL